VQTHLAAHRDLSGERAQAILDPMLAEARRLLADDRVAPDRQRVEMRVDMRYIGQSFELPIPLAAFAETDWAALVPAFHTEHQARFGHSDPAAPVEIVSFGVTATGLIDLPELPRPPKGDRTPPASARTGTRRVYYDIWHDCPVWSREALLAGNEIAGPAIVEEVSATTVLYPGDRARVDTVGSLIVEIGG
jgi:N-methylhydantoinase A